MQTFRILTLLALMLQAAPALPQTAPKPALPIAAISALAPEPSSAPAMPPHTLQAVRLRPFADSFRLIFLFDRVAPYTLREDLAQQRATIEFMNSALSSLPAELAQIKDARLAGIWLKQHDSGLVTLELRFPAAAMRIEHFALDDPPAVVVDLFRTDGDVMRLTSAPEVVTVSTTGPPPIEEAQAPMVPLGAIRITSGTHGSILPALPVSTPAAEEAPKAPEAAAAADEATTTSRNGEPTVQTAALHRGEAGPLDADYEYFPLSALHLQSPAGLAIREAFLARRWATVVKDGLLYLEYNRINPETGDILFMVAESKWQLSKASPDQPIADMLNLYQQASRTDDRGDLGAFSAYRQAQAHVLMSDPESALAALDRAITSTQEAIRQRSLMMRIQALESLHRYDAALAALKLALEHAATTSEKANLMIREGCIKTVSKDYKGAWTSFHEANRLSPNWLASNMEAAKSVTRTAMEVGQLDQALQTVTYLINSQYFADEELWNLTLLYAEILTRQKDLKMAENVYFLLFRKAAQTAKGIDVRKKMLEIYPNDLVDSEGRYCMVLVEKGKIPQAMNELNRAYIEALHDGAPATRLEPAMQLVVPLYLDYAVAHDMPIEAINTWKYYSHATSSAPLRRRCLAPLADAFEKLELYDEALPLIRELRGDRPTNGTATPPELLLQEARLEVRLKNPARGIPLLEGLQQTGFAPQRQLELYDLLADAYLKAGRPLEAAQALQTLADIGGCPPSRRNEALCQAGEIFLGKGMPRQTIELGLKGLIFEKQALEKSANATDNAAGGHALRLMLAKAYLACGDPARQRIVLEDLLRRPGLPVEQKTLAEIMLSNNQRQNGQLPDVEQLYQAIKNDPAADADWRKSADQMQRIMDWNRRHPDQSIEMK